MLCPGAKLTSVVHAQPAKGTLVFEFDQDIVEELLGGDERFQELYQQHATLKTRVHEAEIGIHPLDDLAMNILKRQKLLAKDRMAHIIQHYQREHA